MEMVERWFSELSPQEIYALIHLRMHDADTNIEITRELDDFDLLARHVLVYGQDRELIAYGRAYDTEKTVRIDHLVVEASKRNHRVGSMLVETLVNAANTAFQVKPIEALTPSDAVPFFEKCSFKSRKITEAVDGVPWVWMDRKNK